MNSLPSAAMDAPPLQVTIRHRIGALAIDVAFELTQPWTILFGPSGSGKSTILRTVAGLVRPDSARIVWRTRRNGEGGPVTISEAPGEGFLPAYRRRIPLASQAPNLFPNKTVLENVRYGMDRFQRASGKSEGPVPTRDDLGAMMSLFRIAQLADKLPPTLSGGEAQRVNLARAAAATVEGGILLLDEPFTGLGGALRSELMDDLSAWAREKKLCVLSVTHDVAEAFHLNAEVIQLAEGRVVAQGPPSLVLAEHREQVLRQLGVAKG